MPRVQKRLVMALVVAPCCASAAVLLPPVAVVAIGLLAADGAASAALATWFLGVPLAIVCVVLAFSLELMLVALVIVARSSLWRVSQSKAMLWAGCSALGASLLVLGATGNLPLWPIVLLAGLAGALGGWVFVRVRDGSDSRGTANGPHVSGAEHAR